jgi:hypothetical protein
MYRSSYLLDMAQGIWNLGQDIPGDHGLFSPFLRRQVPG